LSSPNKMSPQLKSFLFHHPIDSLWVTQVNWSDHWSGRFLSARQWLALPRPALPPSEKFREISQNWNQSTDGVGSNFGRFWLNGAKNCQKSNAFTLITKNFGRFSWNCVKSPDEIWQISRFSKTVSGNVDGWGPPDASVVRLFLYVHPVIRIFAETQKSRKFQKKTLEKKCG
jgi:hypothetical protein